jgi:hypothetical protein
MSTYNNELKGALWKNDRKREGKQDPEYTGNAMIGGVEFWLKCWVNTDKSGKKYMSLKFEEKGVKPAEKPTEAPNFDERTNPAEAGFDDAIPF